MILNVVLVADSDCIIRQRLEYSHLIFDDDNTTCQRLDHEVGVTSIELEVKPSRFKISEVTCFFPKNYHYYYQK